MGGDYTPDQVRPGLLKLVTSMGHGILLESLLGGLVLFISFLIIYLTTITVPQLFGGFSKFICYLLGLLVVGFISEYLTFARVITSEAHKVWEIPVIAIFVFAPAALILLLAALSARKAQAQTKKVPAVAFWVIQFVLMLIYVLIHSIFMLAGIGS